MGRPTRKMAGEWMFIDCFYQSPFTVIPSLLKLPQIKKIGLVWQGCHFRIFFWLETIPVDPCMEYLPTLTPKVI